MHAHTKKRLAAHSLACIAMLAVHITLTRATTSWWSLGVQTCATNSAECPECSSLGFLNNNQTELCRRNGGSHMVEAISRGTLEAIRDCKKKFVNWRWDCPTFQGPDLFGKFIEEFTKERAVLNAYMSAGAAHGIARACRDNLIDGCRCSIQSPSVEDGTTFLQACGDDVLFAINFLRSFSGPSTTTSTGSPPPTAPPTSTLAIDNHNNEVGYKVMEERSNYCRCIGLSGSCTLRKCYLRAPAIEEVGETLRIKYDGAQSVDVTSEGALSLMSREDEKPLDDGLVYKIDSPDFCDSQPNIGILGTDGRLCDPHSHGTDGCNIMCCGNGYETFPITRPVEECEFVWCCRLECHVVRNETITEYRCKPNDSN